jgi:hypothetical protein
MPLTLAPTHLLRSRCTTVPQCHPQPKVKDLARCSSLEAVVSMPVQSTPGARRMPKVGNGRNRSLLRILHAPAGCSSILDCEFSLGWRAAPQLFASGPAQDEIEDIASRNNTG